MEPLATGKRERPESREPGALTFADPKEASEEPAERERTNLVMSKRPPGEEWAVCQMLPWLSQKSRQGGLKGVGYL